MGDIAFNIAKDVDLNKVVNLEVNKNVNANVNNPDQLATAEADAEAFGPNALAEVDAYTLVTEPTPGEPGEPGQPGEDFQADGEIDLLGNTADFTLTGDAPNPAAAALPLTLTVDFTSEGADVEGLPDVDDVNGFGSLETLNAPPPGQDDLLPVSGILGFSDDLSLTFDAPLVDQAGSRYTADNDVVITFGERSLDLDGDGEETTDELTLTIPEGSRFLIAQLEFNEFEVEYEGRPITDDEEVIGLFPFWNHADLGDEPVPSTGFVFDSQSLQQEGSIGDWAIQAGIVGEGSTPDIPPTPGTPGEGGTAFAYAESTSALDLNANAV